MARSTRIRALVEECYTTHVLRGGDAVAVPGMRDRVRVEGNDEVFFVVYVDMRRRIADLVCGERVGFLSDIPFSAIRPAGDRAAKR
jgi:hypothetical protein